MKPALRRTRVVAALLVAVAATGAPRFARAQAAADAPPPTDRDQRIDQLERRLTELERQHQRDLESRDKELADLRHQLATRPTTAPAGAAPADDVEKTKQDILKDIESHNDTPITLRTPVSFNPDLAVVVDMIGSWSSDRSNDAANRFDVREAELDLRAAVDPRADGVVVLAFARDVDNPVFPDAGADLSGGPETSAEVEEAYLLLHDFGVPNLTAKVGRFHVRFGRQNILHLHDLPTSDPAFVNQAFLAPEALSDAGVSLSYVIPPAMVGNQYIEIVEEILAGEGASSDSPVFTGDVTVDSPAFNTHVLWNHDLTRDWNVELGGSWMHGHRGADNALDADLFGGDLTLIHTDPTGGFKNLLLQGEVMYGLVDTTDIGRQESWGAYVLGQQQLNRDWYAGLRLDWTEDPNDENREMWGVTPYVSWYWSEFLRFRASYQHRDGDRPAEDLFYLQLTWIFGAHPPHPYWAMR